LSGVRSGKRAGYRVYPSLADNESFHIEFQGEGRYQFTYALNVSGSWRTVFGVTLVLPIGSIGMMREEVVFTHKKTPLTRDQALGLMRVFIVPEDMGTPPGAIALRGATNFQTPPGWDTVYTPVFNQIERPI
jgi:hypothetical protein